MKEASFRSYNAVIAHTVSEAIRLASQSSKNRQLNRRGIAGFCQLQGPTGGGKSSALFRRGFGDNFPAALEKIRDLNYQSIFVTHRWNILHDVFEQASKALDSRGQPIKVGVLYAQNENMVAAVTQSPLPHEAEVQPSALPCCFLSLDELHNQGLFTQGTTRDKLQKSCSQVKSLSKRIARMKSGSAYPGEYIQQDEEKLGRLCSSIERLLLRNMRDLEREVKKAKKRFGQESKEADRARQRLSDYRKAPWIRRVFPAIAWKDEHQHVLIMTTHKLFSSFYDGQQKVRMSSGELSGHVIFIDEFDYQADVLQQLLSQAQLVQEPPECLGQLLDGGKRLIKRMQLATEDPMPAICASLSKLIEDLETELDEKSINLTDARALMMPVDQADQFKTQYLFRSDHLVTSQPLSMSQVEHGYEVRVVKGNTKPQKGEIPVGDFLRLMEQFIRRFSLVVSDLSVTQDEAQEYILKLSRLLFDAVNDYRPSHYGSALPNISLFSLPGSDLPELEPLRKSNLLANSHANIFGLTNWLLQQNVSDKDIDPYRLQIRRAFLPTTPEGLLVSMCSRNLVFGLSATSYIERAIGSFDLRWVRSALRYIADARNKTANESFLGDRFEERPQAWFKKPIPYLQTDKDIAIQSAAVSQIQTAKKEIRQSRLSVIVNKESIAERFEPSSDLVDSLPPSFFQTGEQPVTERTKANRRELLLSLIDVIDKAGSRPHHKGQLAFVNSIRFLKKWLFSDDAETSRGNLDWLELEKANDTGLFEATRLHTFKDIFIPARVHDNDLLICLLTAECQKRPGFHEAYQAAFDTGRVVLVLTQTASATNGINLDFELPSTGKQMDLTCLYLLEARHFYFSTSDSSDVETEMAHAGYQLRNLEKLMRAGEISRQQHLQFILPIMENSQEELPRVNGAYKRTTDYIKNTAADIQQQVGRIERAWVKVPEVEIHLTRELAEVLIKFASLPVYLNNKQQISDLNNQLLNTLSGTQDEGDSQLLSLLMTPQQTGEKAVKLIDSYLVPAIRKARETGKDTHGIGSIWRDLGKAVLQLDYQWKPGKNQLGLNDELYRWACIEKPAYVKGNETWYDPDTWQFFTEPDARRVRFAPDRMYEHIRKSPAVIDWFNKRGYRTSITPPANGLEEKYLFHPKVVQRLLQGRLGEEAIRACLAQEGIITSVVYDNARALELFDFEVADKPIYIDAKFWGRSTLDEADKQYQKWLSEGAKPSETPLGLDGKINAVQALYGKQAKLIIANFVGRRVDQGLHCFDAALRPVHESKASIYVLDGCISSAASEEVTQGFKELVRIIKNHEQKGNHPS